MPLQLNDMSQPIFPGPCTTGSVFIVQVYRMWCFLLVG